MKPSDIQQKLAALGLRATKIRGQHFLIDKTVLDAIVAAAELKRTDTVLEIGPGLGVLTEELLNRAGCVIGVEVDSGFARYLSAEYVPRGLHLVRGDILGFDMKTLVEGCGPYFKVVANIPYNITSALLEKFLTSTPVPKLMVVLIQKEVAERVTATAGAMNRLAALVQYFGKPEIIRVVGRQAFWPAPRVDSAILRIRHYSEEVMKRRTAVAPRQFFFKVVAAGFSAPRKKLVNNLAHGLGFAREVVIEAMKKSRVDLDGRAEKFGMDEWFRIVSSLYG